MKTCPQCGTRFNAHERLCPHDGSVLEPDQPSELSHIGKVLENKYRLDSYLSKGAMGAVYRATHVMLGREVAVKLINPDLVTSPDVVRRFQREARAVTLLNHPNIVDVYDLGQASDGTLYIAMELVVGDSLAAVIRSSGPLPPSRIVGIMRQVVSALALAHRREIVHRDLKPHNIMITRGDDGGELAKLLDFGIAKTFESEATQLTATGFAIGTPKYMSPEQAMGVAVDGRSDLYSLGIIMYEMMTGEVPFNDPSIPALLVKHMHESPVPPSQRRVDLQIPPALEAIALRCLEKDPAQRFQTATELGAALQSLPLDEGLDAVPPSSTLPATELHAPAQSGTRPTVPAAVQPAPPLPVAAPAPPRNRARVAAIAAIVVVLGMIGGGYVAMTRRNDVPPPAVETAAPPVTTPAGAEPPTPAPPATPVVATASPGAAPVDSPPVDSPPPPRTRGATASRPEAAPAASTPSPRTPSASESPRQSREKPIPAAPSMSFECTGPSEVCGPLRQAIQETAEREGFVMTRASNKAVEFVVTAQVAIVDESQQQQFGTTFFVRTYSIDISAESIRFNQDVPMAASKTFTADARAGRERLAENARLAAADAIERVQQFWKKRVG
jgi:serine/threonine protein kinase